MSLGCSYGIIYKLYNDFSLVLKRMNAMEYDSIMNEYDSKLFDVLAQSSNRTFFFASNMKDNTAYGIPHHDRH